MATERIPPKFPKFTDVAAVRRHRKQRLAAAFRVFARLGYDEGLAGHITVRDPELADHFWVNPLGMGFGRIRAKDLLLVNHQGDIVHGTWPLNQAAFVIHSRVHAARPDVVGVAHAHSPHGKAWSAFRRPLEPLTQDACAFYEDHVVFDTFSGAVFELDEGQRIAEALGTRKAAILANHGLLTVGTTSVDEAAYWFIALERVCQVQLLAQAAGAPLPIDHETATKTYPQTGGAYAGWWAFQPLYDWIVELEPDLLDDDDVSSSASSSSTPRPDPARS